MRRIIALLVATTMPALMCLSVGSLATAATGSRTESAYGVCVKVPTALLPRPGRYVTQMTSDGPSTYLGVDGARGRSVSIATHPDYAKLRDSDHVGYVGPGMSADTVTATKSGYTVHGSWDAEDEEGTGGPWLRRVFYIGDGSARSVDVFYEAGETASAKSLMAAVITSARQCGTTRAPTRTPPTRTPPTVARRSGEIINPRPEGNIVRCDGKFAVRPSEIEPTCPAGHAIVSNIEWVEWNTERAIGVGVLTVPSDATYQAQVTLLLDSGNTCKPGIVGFTRIVILSPVTPPPDPWLSPNRAFPAGCIRPDAPQ